MPYTPNYAPGDVLTAAQMNSIGEAQGTYTATWTSSGTAPALGNGIITGFYMRINKLVFFQWSLATGSTSTFGTGTYYFNLPVTGSSRMVQNTPIGNAYIESSDGNVDYMGIAYIDTTSRGYIGVSASAAEFSYDQLGKVSATIPETWTNSGTVKRPTIRVTGTYEVA